MKIKFFLIFFIYQTTFAEKLLDFVNNFSIKEGLTIVPPVDISDYKNFEKVSVTLNIPSNFKADLVFINFLLKESGFSLIKKKESLNLYNIVSNNKSSQFKHLAPLYVNVPIELLPNSDEIIRYIYFFDLINISKQDNASKNFDQLKDMIKTLLSQNSPEAVYDKNLNCVLLQDRGSIIQSIITILKYLDNSSDKETIELLNLHLTSCKKIIEILDTLKLAIDSDSTLVKTDDLNTIIQLLPNLKIVANETNNSLILMGNANHISQVREFIINNLDIPTSEPYQFLHYYRLEYASADELAPILKKLFEETREGEINNGVCIIAEKQTLKTYDPAIKTEEDKINKRLEEIKSLDFQKDDNSYPEIRGLENAPIISMDRLIIASDEQTFKKIEQVIKKLDKCPKMVGLEVALVDISDASQISASGSSRKKASMSSCIGNDLEFISFQAPIGVSTSYGAVQTMLGAPIQSLAGDLLRVIPSDGGSDSDDSGIPSVAQLLAPGSLIISLKDTVNNGIWAILTALKSRISTKVLSHPFSVVKNGKACLVHTKNIKRALGDTGTVSGGSVTIPLVDVEGMTMMHITPKILGDNKIELEIEIVIIDFFAQTGSQQFSRNVRSIKTKAIVKQGEILAIGGLSKLDNTLINSQTPFFGDLPIIGWLFKQESKIKANIYFCAFIKAEIENPKNNVNGTAITNQKLQKVIPDIFDNTDNSNMSIIEKFTNNSTNLGTSLCTNLTFEDKIGKIKRKIKKFKIPKLRKADQC